MITNAAGTNVPSTPETPTPKVADSGTGTGKASNADVLALQGEAEIASMTKERHDGMGSKRGILHLQHLVGLQSAPVNVTKAGGVQEQSFRPIGIAFISDEDLSVPSIPIQQTHITGVTDMSMVQVKKGEKFILSYIETFFLFLSEPFLGHCEAGGSPLGVKLVVKTPKYFEGKQKLPTPTFELTDKGSIKDGIVAIDQKDAAGSWEAKPEYAEKFGVLFNKTKPSRASGSGAGSTSKGPKDTKATKVAVALQKIMGAQMAVVNAAMTPKVDAPKADAPKADAPKAPKAPKTETK